MENLKTNLCGHEDVLSVGLFAREVHPNSDETVMLTEAQIAIIVGTLSPKANQERRFIEYLAANPLSKTKDCCRAIACVNLSHLRRVTASTLAKYGLEAKCEHPPKPIKNGFGESTGQVLWALYKLRGAE